MITTLKKALNAAITKVRRFTKPSFEEAAAHFARMSEDMYLNRGYYIVSHPNHPSRSPEVYLTRRGKWTHGCTEPYDGNFWDTRAEAIRALILVQVRNPLSWFKRRALDRQTAPAPAPRESGTARGDLAIVKERLKAAEANRDRLCTYINIIGTDIVGRRIGAFKGGNCAPDAVARETKKLIERMEASQLDLVRALKQIAANPGDQDPEVGFISGHIAKGAIRAFMEQKN